MNAQQFVDRIKKAVMNRSIESVRSNLTRPPGRKPAQKLTAMSDWYNQLAEKDKNIVLEIVKEAAETTVFGFLCVLDGVRPIEDEERKGRLELYFKKDCDEQLLNDPEGQYLHDLFN